MKRAEKIQEIQGWLKTHPVSSTSRASCDLQILDAGIVEKIEEELEKTKVRITYRPLEPQQLQLLFLSLCWCVDFSGWQAKKMNKKVRVTVKPHLLFRVCVSMYMMFVYVYDVCEVYM